jgi:hypothetical protein
MDLKNAQPQVSEKEYRDFEKAIYQPLENYRVGRNEIVAGTVSPSYRCRSRVFSVSRRSWTNTSAASAPTT